MTGSRDGTLRVARELHAQDDRVRYVSFSRNFGKEAGIYAGLKAAKGDYIATMDADLQDPPALLPQMLDTLLTGDYDCAATRRTTRKGRAAAAQLVRPQVLPDHQQDVGHGNCRRRA